VAQTLLRELQNSLARPLHWAPSAPSSVTDFPSAGAYGAARISKRFQGILQLPLLSAGCSLGPRLRTPDVVEIEVTRKRQCAEGVGQAILPVPRGRPRLSRRPGRLKGGLWTLAILRTALTGL